MLPLIILTRGLPGSGKTTWSEMILERYPEMFIHISRDQIRLEIKSENNYDGHIQEREERDRRIRLALEANRNVIVDETNLKIQNVVGLQNKFQSKAQIQIKDFTDANLDECITRRRGIVPENEIRKKYADMRIAMEKGNWPTFPEPSFKIVEQTEYVDHE